MPDDKSKKSDPTVTSKVPSGYQVDRGNHPPRPLTEVTDAAVHRKYADNEDKPDPTTVAQVEVGPDKP